jgi:hypothetical protein
MQHFSGLSVFITNKADTRENINRLKEAQKTKP